MLLDAQIQHEQANHGVLGNIPAYDILFWRTNHHLDGTLGAQHFLLENQWITFQSSRDFGIRIEERPIKEVQLFTSPFIHCGTNAWSFRRCSSDEFLYF